MCGIVGFSCQKPDTEKIELLQELIIQSKIRGLHSFGYSYLDNDIKTKKRYEIKNINLPLSNKIIYHNRYSTSGGYENHNKFYYINAVQIKRR